ncbi:hypothetical protein [Lacihabitans lacunae]|uniref:Gliding motility protein n=1 Tax=Lacihabitans lacunae TaxID=1028214 RepID=A0ABV7Z024_9BACT
MSKKNIYLFSGFASIFIAQIFDNPYIMIGLGLLGAILLLLSGTYKNNKN